jgi:hypothetical protein
MTRKEINEDTFKDISFKVFNDSVPLRGDKKKAQLLGVKLNENGEIVCDIIKEHGDIYDLIDNVQASEKLMSKLGQYDLVSILTGGWAAPLNNDGNDDLPPSQHPERKRVLISIMGYSVKQVSSVMAFEGEDEEQHYDYNKGQGALRDAFDELLSELNWV